MEINLPDRVIGGDQAARRKRWQKASVDVEAETPLRADLSGVSIKKAAAPSKSFDFSGVTVKPVPKRFDFSGVKVDSDSSAKATKPQARTKKSTGEQQRTPVKKTKAVVEPMDDVGDALDAVFGKNPHH